MINEYFESDKSLYEIYLEDDNEMEMNNEIELTDKGVNKNSSILKRKLYPIIEDKLSDNKNIQSLLTFINNFISKNIEALSATGPIELIPFNNRNINQILNIFEIDETFLTDLCKEAEHNAFPNKAYDVVMVNAGPEHKILFAGIAIYGLKHNNQNALSIASFLLAFAQYPIAFHQFWRLGVKQDVMEYTIEHLSNQFAIRKHPNILSLMTYMTQLAIDTHKERLKTNMDHTYFDLGIRVKNAFYSSFTNIAKAYYKNYENNNTIHTQVDEYEDGNLSDVEGNMNNINEITNDIYNKFIINGIEESLVAVASRGTSSSMSVDKVKLSSYLNTIKSHKDNKIKQFIESILYLFFNKFDLNDDAINSTQFLSYGINLYKSISLSKDEHSTNLKNILNMWVDICGLRENISRDATIIAYKKAIFVYFILAIQKYK